MPGNKLRAAVGATVAGALGLSISPAAAGPYTFQNVADSTGPFQNALFRPTSINNSGKVTFSALLKDDTPDEPADDAAGIFTGPNLDADTVVDTRGPFARVELPAINDAGRVAFIGELDATPDTPSGVVSGVFTGRNPATDTVADTRGPYQTFLDIGERGPAISASGRVIFSASLDEGGGGLYSGPNPDADVVADTRGGAFRSVGTPAVNGPGGVAFIGVLADDNSNPFDNPSGIFTGPDTSADTVVDSAGPFSTFFDLDLNDTGDVAFVASLDDDDGIDAVFGIFTGTDPVADRFFTATGTFGSLSAPAINDAGTIAFGGEFLDGGYGIFAGPDLVADKVIATGDTLFGATVTSLSFFGALNDRGDIAFFYNLDDLRTGVAVASVAGGPGPNPIALPPAAAGAVSVLGPLSLLHVRRLRRLAR